MMQKDEYETKKLFVNSLTLNSKWIGEYYFGS